MLVFVVDGQSLPITNMFDVDGDETDDPTLATVIVAALPNGQWLTTECYEGEIKRIEG